MSTINSKILFFCEGISYGHIARSLILAKWLKSLTYPMVIACPQKASGLFAAEGFETINIETADSLAIYKRLRQGKTLYTAEELLNYFKQDDHLIKQVQPFLIVSEFRFTILQLAKKYGIPAVGMTDAGCHPHLKDNVNLPEGIMGQLSRPYQEASTRYKIELLPTFFDYASQGDICLLADHPALIPIEPLRSGDLYTGPLLWNRPEPLPHELSRLNPDTDTVYISLGTQESLSTGFLDTYVEKLLEHNLQVIVSRGKRSVDLSVQHDNLFIFDFVNDSKLLPLVDLLVYPGGAMSTYQALSSAVPLITLPAHQNQFLYGEALVRNHLGLMLPSLRMEFNQLILEIMTVLKDKKIKEGTEKLPEKIASLVRNYLGLVLPASHIKVNQLTEKTMTVLRDEKVKAQAKKFQAAINSFTAKDEILKRINCLIE